MHRVMHYTSLVMAQNRKRKLHRLVVLITDDMLEAIDAKTSELVTRADIVREALARSLHDSQRGRSERSSIAHAGIPA